MNTAEAPPRPPIEAAKSGKMPRIPRFSGTVWLFVAMNAANVLAYLYQVVMGRMLGPADFGLLGSIIALTNVITVSATALQTAPAKVIAARTTAQQPIARITDDPLT